MGINDILARHGAPAAGFAALLSVACAGAAADAERGRLLYENHCQSCHDSVVHVRSQRRAASVPELVWQIARWERHLGLDWRFSEVADVLAYLNGRYYRFDQPLP